MIETRWDKQLWRGVAWALAAAVLFGAAAPLSKPLSRTLDPFMLAGLLYLGAGVGLGCIKSFVAAKTDEAKLQRADWPWLLAAIVAGGVVAPALLMAGLARTSASSAALLLNLEGLATMGVAWTVFRENVDARLALGALAILTGAALLSWNGAGFAVDSGAGLVAGACLFWGVDNNLTRKISAADPIAIAILKGCVAGSVNVGLALATGSPLPSLGAALAAALIGFWSVGVSLALYIRALRQLGAARTAAYFSLAPFIGALLSFVLLGESLTLTMAAAGLLMALGLWLHLAERHGHEHTHDPIEHDHAHVHDVHHQHDHQGPVDEPHAHPHRHGALAHAHVHYPDLHHRHRHS